jgi:hypothetical protein
MGPITIVFGILLTAVGAWGYFGSEQARTSATALIPAFVGLPLVLLGLLALKDNWRKHAMHAAAALGLIGFLAAVGRLVQKSIQDGLVMGRPVIGTLLMALLCGVFVGLCVKSFIDARRRRARAELEKPVQS